YNHIKQMVDIDVNYAESQGSLWHFAKDTLDSSDPAEFVATPFPSLSAVGVGLTAGAGAQPLTGVAGAGSTTILNARNPAFNKGALNRIQFLTPYYFQKGAIYYYTLRVAVPVKLMSGFFEQLDFPLFNVPMKMNLGLCGTQAGPQTNPFMASGLGAGVSVQFAIGNADINHPAIESKCKWYLPKVEFTPKITTLLAPHLEKGLIKKVIFYSARTEQNLATSNTLDKELTNGIKSPRRIWTVLQPKGSATSQNSASPCIATGSITNVNLQIGADNFFKNDLKFDYEMYMIFKQQQFHGGDDFNSGSQVSFNDFANGVHKYHVIDLARKDFNPGDNIPLFLRATIGKNGVPDSNNNAYQNYDIFHSVEHELEVVINMTNQDVFVNGTV
ncbi:MAG: hypothetical protein P4L35_14180, partial [Ignavibacteriaceae bacterium]|nr:hypothetical protein [Ignavibacteriaceae bacterium]